MTARRVTDPARKPAAPRAAAKRSGTGARHAAVEAVTDEPTRLTAPGGTRVVVADAELTSRLLAQGYTRV